MKKREESRLEAAVVAGLIIAITLQLFPLVFDQSEGLWKAIVTDYQTLWAGLMAVAAAAVTISQMRKEAAREDERHKESLFNQNLPNYLAIMRLRAHVPDTLSRHAQPIERFAATVVDKERPWVWNREDEAAFALASYSVIEILTTLDERLMTDCSALFTPTIATGVGDCRKYAMAAVSHFPSDCTPLAFLFDGMPEERPAWVTEGLSALVIDVGSYGRQLATDLDAWADVMLADVK